MTDEEVICMWMEPNADSRSDNDFEWWGQSWKKGERTLFPRKLDLDALHEVEGRLTDEQWKFYDQQLETGVWPAPQEVYWNSHQAMETLYLRRLMIHADAPTRIKALASMLRPIVAAKQ